MFEVICNILNSDIETLMKTGLIASFPTESLDNRNIKLFTFIAADSATIAEKRFCHAFGGAVKINNLEIKPIASKDIQTKDWLVYAMYEAAVKGKIDGRIEFSL